MKILLTILLAITHTYANQSVLNEGTWVKMRVQENGIYRLSDSDIRAAGLDPQTLHIYGYGGEQLSQDFTRKMIDDLCEVPYYAGNGYVLFYGQGNISWRWDGSRYRHTRNTYSDYGYYLMTSGSAERSLLSESEGVIIGSIDTIRSYDDLLLHEQDLINLIDQAGVSGGGREFYGETFSTSSPNRTFRMATHNLTGEPMTANIEIATTVTSATSIKTTVGAGSTITTTIPAKSMDNYTMAAVKSYTCQGVPNGTGQQQIVLTYQPTGSSTAFLNYIELVAPTELRDNGKAQIIRTSRDYGRDYTHVYELRDAGNATMVWDVSNRDNIHAVTSHRDGGKLYWNGTNKDYVSTYVAVNPNATYPTPTIIGKVDNQNLHALRDIDMVIITPKEFVGAAQQLADKHSEVDHLITAVVTDEQVYNEFSSGTPDATAYRRLMKMLYDRGQAGEGQAPRFLLLMGDGSFDNRKILNRSGNNWLLTYESANSINEVKSYATDDYFGFMDNTTCEVDYREKMRLSVGRLPVNSAAEAYEVVAKICQYMDNKQIGQWKQQLTYLADDGDNGSHTITAEGSAERVRLANQSFVVNKIYLDAYTQEISASGESYPVAYRKLHNLLDNGTLYFNYAGHGGYNNITNEGMMSLTDVKKMRNANQAFWMFATCSFAHFDSGTPCAAELAVTNPNGGAIGVLSACRTVYATQNTTLNRNVTDSLFKHNNDPCGYGVTIGEATSRAKNATGSDENKMAYVLLGDPALRMNWPTHYQVLTTVAPDTVRALSTHTIEGIIADSEGQVNTEFNGSVDITIYDKLQELTTLDNDETNPDKRKKLTYKDYPNRIYHGQATVEDGRFSFSFITPKDIRYNYDNGRIVYYAVDTMGVDYLEAIGHYEEFVIGGSSPVEHVDTLGPQMQLYLNDPLFHDGDKTNEKPHFFALLSDESGINTSGSGIGHDMLLTVDEDVNQVYILNDYYTNDIGTFTSGRVSYPMAELESGHHTLRFRAWDMNNNSTTDSLHFEVVKGLTPNVLSAIALPNPVSRHQQMAIVVNEDRPDDTEQIRLKIYDIRGCLVYEAISTQERVFQFSPEQAGMSHGMYAYTVSLKTTNGQLSNSRTGKIIVK